MNIFFPNAAENRIRFISLIKGKCNENLDVVCSPHGKKCKMFGKLSILRAQLAMTHFNSIHFCMRWFFISSHSLCENCVPTSANRCKLFSKQILNTKRLNHFMCCVTNWILWLLFTLCCSHRKIKKKSFMNVVHWTGQLLILIKGDFRLLNRKTLICAQQLWIENKNIVSLLNTHPSKLYTHFSEHLNLTWKQTDVLDVQFFVDEDQVESYISCAYVVFHIILRGWFVSILCGIGMAYGAYQTCRFVQMTLLKWNIHESFRVRRLKLHVQTNDVFESNKRIFTITENFLFSLSFFYMMMICCCDLLFYCNISFVIFHFGRLPRTKVIFFLERYHLVQDYYCTQFANYKS